MGDKSQQLCDENEVQESFGAKNNTELRNPVQKSRFDAPHVALFADFVEESANNDLDTFLTRVNTMPMNSQNKLLQEKLILLNERLANVFEEIQSVQKFHGKMATFFTDLKKKVINKCVIKVEVNAQGIDR